MLGPRLREITTAALPHAPDARKLFGAPDDLKFHACMTLFDATVGGDPFAAALSAFFAGRAHPTTLELLG